MVKENRRVASRLPIIQREDNNIRQRDSQVCDYTYLQHVRATEAYKVVSILVQLD